MAWEVAFPVKNELGEGPVFDTVTGCLFWCDIIGRTVLAGDTQTGLIKTFGFGEPVSAVFLTDTDRLLVAGASGLYQLNPKTGTRDLILPIEKDNPITRANDSRVAPGNSIWFGTMAQARNRRWRHLSRQRRQMHPLVQSNIHPQRNLLFARWPHRLLL